MYFGNTDKLVLSKVQEILDRPDVQKELTDAIEASVREDIDQEVKRRTKDYVRSYDSGFRRMVDQGINAWIQAHLDDVNALIDKAAEQAVLDETVYQGVAQESFQRFLTKMASEAVAKAMAKQAKKRVAK